MPSSPEPTISHSDDLDFFKDFENKFPDITYNDDLTSKLTEPSIWYLYHLEIRDTSSSDFVGLTEGMRQTLGDRLRMVYTGDEGHELMNDTEMGLDVADTLCFQLVKSYPIKGDHMYYWIEILFDRDFLGPPPSYVYIRDPMRRLCHRMIAYSISGKGHAPENVTEIDLFYLRSMDREMANVPYLLNICVRLSDTWAWVAPGPERQQVATAGAPEAAEDAPADVEGVPAAPAPVQAAQPPPAARTISQRLARLDEDVYGIQAAGGISQLLDSARATYTRYYKTHVPYQRRRVRRRTGDASTSTAQLIFTCVYYDMMAFDLFVNDRIKTGNTQYGVSNLYGYADAIRRPCCEEIDDMVYSEKDVC
ncbi:hypothetical protein Tco_0627989 [Tanacetum coccineum]|uniref:Uncharacterized protein n=1 Tax=Tanacetum coccineum TaxID=301880 RepID=A0ABQ4WP37_9ASTR